jgi:hypothetical protein
LTQRSQSSLLVLCRDLLLLSLGAGAGADAGVVALRDANATAVVANTAAANPS